MKFAIELGLTPSARLVSPGSHAQLSEWFTTEPVAAIRKELVLSG